MSERAFQDQMGHNCWGCGPKNPKGLQIKTVWSETDPKEAITIWKPAAEHCADEEGLRANGGIIYAVMDCMSTSVAAAYAYRKEGRAIGTEPQIWYVTGRGEARYFKPTPTREPWTVRMRVTKVQGRKMWLAASLFAKDEECARGKFLVIRVTKR